jgi:hypothetical protein
LKLLRPTTSNIPNEQKNASPTRRDSEAANDVQVMIVQLTNNLFELYSCPSSCLVLSLRVTQRRWLKDVLKIVKPMAQVEEENMSRKLVDDEKFLAIELR